MRQSQESLPDHVVDTASEVQRVVIIGAGPGGLCAAYELRKAGHQATILEADPHQVGGLSKTLVYKGHRFDIGGHRFFSKNPEIVQLWREILGDDLISVDRLSRIYYQGKLFDYPLKAINAFRSLGLGETLRCLASYAWAHIHPRLPESSFEDWISNRFGRRLFQIFFETYTEKVWGIPCREISADWAAQRIRRLNLGNAILNALGLGYQGGSIKTLIDRFDYPRLGPGMLWERLSQKLSLQGCPLHLGQPVTRIEWGPQGVTAVRSSTNAIYPVDHLISTMPLRRLIECLNPAAPPEVLQAAQSLSYRDFLTVALVVDAPQVFPDNWIYLHDPQIKAGRVQNYKNWSPAMVSDPRVTVLGVEYFCFAGDGLWNMADSQLIELATRELTEVRLIRPDQVSDGAVLRIHGAYPIYTDTHQTKVSLIREFLEQRLPNLQIVGRNGMHRYNNMDHSMLTGLLAARNILGQGQWDLWQVNGDAEYLEEGETRDARLVPRSSFSQGVAH